MRLIAVLTACVLAWAPTGALGFESSADDEGGFRHMLALMHTVVGIAAQSEDPKVVEKRMDEVFAGRNPEANRAAAGLLGEMTRDMTDETSVLTNTRLSEGTSSRARRECPSIQIVTSRGALGM